MYKVKRFENFINYKVWATKSVSIEIFHVTSLGDGKIMVTYK